ncbi:hypothetical protein [Kitasatospora sp. NPDC059571]|uniref:hypothetical protein n=1 Tax=Kitasatospora sp. NPDC059571 TaxID=3346871 RepID=UPI003683799E
MTASALTDDRTRLLETAQPLCLRYGLALAGPDALAAHGLAPTRATALLLVAAEGPPLADIAAGLVELYRAAGHEARSEPGTPRRLQITGPPVPIDLHKEPLRHPVVLLAGTPVPVAALPDAAALAVLALCDRALPADLAAVHSLAARFTQGELTALAAGLDDDFQTTVLAERLEAAAGLLHPNAAAVCAWAQAWAQDLRLDLMETRESADGLHDPYLETVEAEQSDDL